MAVSRLPRRTLHTTKPDSQTVMSSSVEPSSINPALLHPTPNKIPTRQHLQRWNEKYGGPDEMILSAFEKHPTHHGDIQNNVSKPSYSSKADEDLQEDQMPGEEGEGEELLTIGLFLKPGDVVELSQPGREPVLAVFVKQLDFLSQFYSINGRWCHSRLSYISFAIPGAIDPSLLQPLLPYMPAKIESIGQGNVLQIPRDLGAPIQAKLHQLTQDSERIYRTNAPILDTAYSILADATRTRMMTLSQIAKTLLAKNDPTWSPSPSALLAVRKALNHNEFRFRSDARSQRLTNVFAIRPKHDVQVVETVHEWIRDYREHEAALANPNSGRSRLSQSAGASYVVDFVEKSKRLIAESREHGHTNPAFAVLDQAHKPATQHSPGIKRSVWGEKFNKADQQIIACLQAWVLTDQFNNMPNLHSACASILHATGCYVDPGRQTELPVPQMDRSTGYLFLQEIGVITTFENRFIYNENLMLPTVRVSRNLELLNTKAELTRRNPDFRDAMSHFRRDWGATTVYCIDSADAKEIDDGVSIERVPGKPSEYWIHVHVANPTAFFDKTHVLSGLAAHMTETIYTPERSFAMLPSWASQNYFSLTSNRPVITFSSRIDDAGNLLETKIQHGIIRNVVSITPAELSTYLDEPPKESLMRLVVGGEISTKNKARPLPRLSAEQVQNLRDLYSAAKSLWKWRKAAGGARLGFGVESDVLVYENPLVPGLTWMPPSVERARRVVGNPIIELRGLHHDFASGYFTKDIDTRNITEEIMLLACRTAGSWCAERNIPAMFRGTVEDPTSPLSLTQFREQVLQPNLEKSGHLTMGVGLKYLAALGRAISHSSPISHKIIGVESYIKVTSPLRRFSDMIAHWQIEAALRYEARTGQKLNAKLLANSSRPILPFSARQIHESIITLSPRETMIKATQRSSRTFWTVQAFMRAFYYQEAPLPETFTARIMMPCDHAKIPHSSGIIEKYGVNIMIARPPNQTTQTGDQWEVKIRYINPFRNLIYTDPIRLLHRDEFV